MPIVITAAMTQGQFLTGDFSQAALIFDREQARVDISTENVDDFQKNLCTIRAEMRIGLANLRPAAIVVGTLP